MVLTMGIAVQIGHRKFAPARRDVRSLGHWIGWGIALIWLWKFPINAGGEFIENR